MSQRERGAWRRAVTSSTPERGAERGLRSSSPATGRLHELVSTPPQLSIGRPNHNTLCHHVCATLSAGVSLTTVPHFAISPLDCSPQSLDYLRGTAITSTGFISAFYIYDFMTSRRMATLFACSCCSYVETRAQLIDGGLKPP